MKKNTKKVYSTWSVRDEHGRFVSHTYTGRTYVASNGKLEKKTQGVSARIKAQYEENQKPVEKQRTIRSAQIPLKEAIVTINNEQSTSEIIYGAIEEDYNIQDIAKKTSSENREIVHYGQKIIEGDFEMNYSLYKKYGEGFNREQQRKFYDLMVLANNEGDKIGEYTNELLHPRFSVIIPNDIETIEKRLKAAKEVISGDYINSTYTKYYADFLENYKYHLEDEDFKKLKNAISGLSPYELFKMLSDNAWASRPYSLESEITEYSYEWVWNETELIIDKAKKEKAKRKKELEKTNKKSKNST